MRSPLLALALLVAACGGGGSKAVEAPAKAPAVTRLEIAEISISANDQSLVVRKNGDVEVIGMEGPKLLGTLTADGKFTLPNGDSGQLQDDGSFTTKDGPAPFKLDGDTLVVGTSRLTLDAKGAIQGAAGDVSSIRITGVTNEGTRRTALLMIGFITLAK